MNSTFKIMKNYNCNTNTYELFAPTHGAFGCFYTYIDI